MTQTQVVSENSNEVSDTRGRSHVGSTQGPDSSSSKSSSALNIKLPFEKKVNNTFLL